MIPHCFAALVEPPYVCARIIAHDRGSYLVATEGGDYRAQLLGAFRFEFGEPGAHPVVGDYVSITICDELALIDSVLTRTNLFARRAIDGSHVLQPIAANLDTLFVTVAVNRDFNLRRLERYVIAAAAFGVPFAVALTKIDLVDDLDDFVEAARSVVGATPIVALCGIDGRGLAELLPFRGPERTIAFVGSSGVGKSTIINSLLGTDLLEVNEIRASDDRGQHTTTRRLLLRLADGTSIIDTPGMREFALADANEGVGQIFPEMEELADSCRFRDCRHDAEPGCAVRENVAEERLDRWRKLGREAAFETRKHDARAAAEERARWKAISKANRQRNRW